MVTRESLATDESWGRKPFSQSTGMNTFAGLLDTKHITRYKKSVRQSDQRKDSTQRCCSASHNGPFSIGRRKLLATARNFGTRSYWLHCRMWRILECRDANSSICCAGGLLSLSFGHGVVLHIYLGHESWRSTRLAQFLCRCCTTAKVGVDTYISYLCCCYCRECRCKIML